jgi:parallel beta-helix repeat protein
MRKRLLFLLFFVISFSYSQLVVNTEIDTIDAGDGLLSLREAVIAANSTAGQQTIRFNETVFLPGANRIIFLKTALQLIDNDGVIINGEDGKVTLDGSIMQLDLGPLNGLILEGGNNDISNLYFQNFSWAAILIDHENPGNNMIGPNNKISNCLGAGILILDSENNTVAGNNIWNCGLDSLLLGDDYLIENQDGVMLITNANSNTIEENNIWANYGSGIGAYMCGQNTIQSNYIVINEGSGIQLLDDSGENMIQANDLLGNEFSGIYLYDGSGNTISGNSIGDTTTIPQSYLQAGVSSARSETAFKSTGGIIIQQEGNRITDFGMMLSGIKDSEITENFVSGCDDYGIFIQGHQKIDSIGGVPDTTYHFPEGILVAMNRLERNRFCSIYLMNTIEATIQQNYIGFSSSGIQGSGLTSWSPEVVGRDSIERGDFVVESNIISSIGGGVDRKIIAANGIGGAISLDHLQSAAVSNNEISKSSTAMYYSYITNLTVQENRVESINSSAINIQIVDSSLVENNRLTNIGSNGIYIYNSLTSFTSSAGIIDNILSDIAVNALTCTTVTSLDVTGNTISRTGQYGIYLYDCDDSSLDENEISGCTASSIFAFTANTVDINDNRITDPNGLMPYSSIELSSISNASIAGNLISDARSYGILAGETDTVFVTGNEIITSQNSGCYLGPALFIYLENNELYGNQNGVYINSADSIIVQNNTVSRNGSSGMVVNTVGFCRVVGNFIFENGGSGLNPEGVDSCVVESNYIATNNYGYATSSPSGQLLRSNTFQGNKIYGAYCGAVEDSLDARENYWGHANGPATSDTLYPGIAVGDRVNETVLFQPFLTSPPVWLSVRPVISYLEPDQSPVEGGGTASLHGRQFMPGAQVYFGSDTVQQVQYFSSDLLVLTIPPAANGYRDVIVVNPSGLADTLKNGFLYGEPTVQNEMKSNLPLQYALYQNYPNPFNPSTTIRYDIVDKSHVELIIYNILGQKVVTLVNKQQNPGSYSVDWNASRYPSGIYFYLLRSEYFTKTQKLILIK